MKYPTKDSDNDTVKELENKYGGKKNGWVGIDKNFVQYLPIDRPYTELEAMLSYTVDIDNGVKMALRSYARIWQWSRTKVKKFLTEIAEPEQGHHPYQFRATTRPPVFFINKNLWQQKSQSEANFEPEQSQSEATTINPNPNPNKKNSPSNSASRSWDTHSWQYKFAKRFYELKQDNYGEYKFMQDAARNDFQDWSNTIDKLRRIDGKTQDEIAEVLRFSVDDEFWSRNLLSLSTLRKKNGSGIMKYENILNKMNTNSKHEPDYVPEYHKNCLDDK